MHIYLCRTDKGLIVLAFMAGGMKVGVVDGRIMD
jgi:hypothetical protein